MSDQASENKEIQFTLDGQSVYARPGETVLGVAKRMGIEIPALCHHDAVSPYGACRLCVVEVFWGKRSKLVTSCIYTPWEGDVVETGSDRVCRTRRMVLSLLLARCPEVETLQDMAREYGAAAPFDTAEEDGSERCILCGLCVRVCDEVVGQHAIGHAHRGMERAISAPFADRSDDCIGCAACVYICPTGALHYEDVDGRRTMVELQTDVPLFPCRVCGAHFAPVEQVERVRECLKLPEALAETCPDCRGREIRGIMEEVLAVPRSKA
ncbi:MAG: 4Fe-4S dicluster domain-containing protein [Nitrospiraceae bacterium]|nr:4Fe-4S dicluster domain-containing protein [Nitrospiraceae bacterium]